MQKTLAPTIVVRISQSNRRAATGRTADNQLRRTLALFSALSEIDALPEINLPWQHERARCIRYLAAGVRIASSRLSVSARDGIETGRQCDHAIRAAYRFVGTNAGPGPGRNLTAIGDIGKPGGRAGRMGIEAEVCDVWRVPFVARARCRCRSRGTSATKVVRR